MKLLGWMHRKLWQTGGHNFENDQACKYISGGTSPEHFNVFASYASVKEDGDDHQDNVFDPADVVLFDGFLSIGTLGSVPMLGNYTKLDKECDNDDDDDGDDDDDDDNDDILNGAVTPKFGVPVEIDNRVIKVELEKVIADEAKKLTGVEESLPVRRASLAELFLRSKLEESIDSPITEKNIQAKQSTAKKRFRKFMQVFHRKVHPENMSGVVQNNVTKEVKQEIKGKPPISRNLFKSEVYRKFSFSCFKCGSSTSPPMLEENDSCPRISREHWIKTDAEYLVLEL